MKSTALGIKGWTGVLVAVVVIAVLVPLLNLAVPSDSALHLDDFYVGLGVLNKLLEGWQGAVLAKIMVLVFIVIFIQKRPQGIFAMKGRSAEA